MVLAIPRRNVRGDFALRDLGCELPDRALLFSELERESPPRR